MPVLIVLLAACAPAPEEECWEVDPTAAGVYDCTTVDLCCTGDDPCLLRTKAGTEYRCMPDTCDWALERVWCDPDACSLPTSADPALLCGGV